MALPVLWLHIVRKLLCTWSGTRSRCQYGLWCLRQSCSVSSLIEMLIRVLLDASSICLQKKNAAGFIWEIRHPGVTWYKSEGAWSFISTNSARFRNNQITCRAAFLSPVCFPLMVYYSTALGIVVCIDHNIPDCAWRQQSVSWHESERARSFIVTNSCKPTEQAQSCSSVYITISALLISLHWCTFLGAENATLIYPPWLCGDCCEIVLYALRPRIYPLWLRRSFRKRLSAFRRWF